MTPALGDPGFSCSLCLSRKDLIPAVQNQQQQTGGCELGEKEKGQDLIVESPQVAPWNRHESLSEEDLVVHTEDGWCELQANFQLCSCNRRWTTFTHCHWLVVLSDRHSLFPVDWYFGAFFHSFKSNTLSSSYQSIPLAEKTGLSHHVGLHKEKASHFSATSLVATDISVGIGKSMGTTSPRGSPSLQKPAWWVFLS